MNSRLFLAVLLCTLLSITSLPPEDSRNGELISEATAEPKVKRKRSRCVKYSQLMGADKQSVDVRLRNRCASEMTCSIEWKLSCDADPADAPVRDRTEIATMKRGDTSTMNLSAAACGDDGWSVDDIQWNCNPE